MSIDLSLYGPDIPKFVELLKMIDTPLKVTSKPFFENHYSEVRIECSNGYARFYAAEHYRGMSSERDKVDYVDFELSTLSAQKGRASVALYCQVRFNSEDIEEQSTVGVYKFTTRYRSLLWISEERRDVIISGISIKIGADTINISLSDYDGALHVTRDGDEEIWKNHTLLSVLDSETIHSRP